MLGYLRKHPFGTVLTAAVLLRLIAVLFSKGYMASDDQFETVDIAYYWLQHGLWDQHGHLVWSTRPAATISRFPLYTLLLYFNMYLTKLFGPDSLDGIMYSVRSSHAAVSLVGVVAVYRIVEIATKSRDWAMIAGLLISAHFAMPFLAVRTLIEMVGGTIWIVDLYYYYRFRDNPQEKYLVIAGLLSGLAWMIRFQIIFAFWIVPILLWIEFRKMRVVALYFLPLIAMLFISGIVDVVLLGKYFGSTINHVRQGLTQGPEYSTSFLIYAGVLVGYLIPPVSIVALFLMFRRRFWEQHAVLCLSTFSFIVFHTLIASRQERYMIVVFPAVLVLAVLAFHQNYIQRGFAFQAPWLYKSALIYVIAANLILLIPFSLYYGHKGLVEPLVKIERISDGQPSVLFFSPDIYRAFPYSYGGFKPIGRDYVYHWDKLDNAIASEDSGLDFDYYLLYPPDSSKLAIYKDSLSSRVGEIEELFIIRPTLVERILYHLNPKHNRSNEVWVFRKIPGDGAMVSTGGRR